jgi:hypothetical protein
VESVSTPDASNEEPTQRQPATWIGTAALPARRLEDTLDLPIDERVPPPPEIRYVPVPVYPPGYGPPQKPPRYGPPPQKPPRYGPPPQKSPRYRPPPVPPQFPRKRRKWPWVLLTMALLCAGCCGGAFLWSKQIYDQYPASAATDATVAGLTAVEDDTADQVVNRLRGSIDTEQIDEARFSVVYRDKNKRRVTVFGTTRLVTDPNKAIDASITQLTSELQLADVHKVDAGPLGGQERCGTGRLDGRSISMCAWADHGSMGVGLFAGRSIESSSPTLQEIRAAIIQRD